MDEQEIQAMFGGDYSPPVVEDDYIDDWSNSIEIKLSRQGKLIIGIGGVVLATLMLTVLQGKVVITLVKAHKSVVDTLNGIISGPNSSQPVQVSYTEPQGKVDESKIEPLNPEELEELRIRMEASTKDAEEGLL